VAGLLRRRLLGSLAKSQPRLLRIIAPAGYGKSTLARQYAEGFASVATCDCLGATSAVELAERLASALSSAARGVDAPMVETLSLGEDVTALRAFCGELWRSPAAPRMLVIENGEMLEDDVGARSVVTELLSSPNLDRHVTLCSRVSLSLRSGRFATPNEIVTVGAADLRFDRSEIAAVLDKPMDDPLVARVDMLTEGWPMAVLFIARLFGEGKRLVLDEADRIADLGALYDYIAEQVFESLDARQKEILTALSFLPEPTNRDLERLHLRMSQKTLLADIARMAPFVTCERAGTYAVHPLMRAMLRERHAERKQPLLQRIAQRTAEGGDAARAAQLYFEAGDEHAAARSIDYGGTFFSTPSPAMADLMTQIDSSVMVHYPALWIAATMARAYAVPPQQWMREGEFVWRNLTGKEDLRVRAGVMFSLASAYANDGRFADALRLCNELEDSLTTDERALGHSAAEFLRGAIRLYGAQPLDFDRFRAAIAPFLEYSVARALADYDFSARLHRLNGQRAEERAVLERALHTALESNLPLLVSLIAMDAAFGAWLAGEDDLFERYLALLEEHAPASVISACRLFIDAARGRIDNLTPGYEQIKMRAYAYVIAASKADGPEKARILAQQAVAAGDHSAQPFAQVLARICLGTVAPEHRTSALNEARTISARVASARFRTDLERVIAGRANGTMWAKLVERFESRRAGNEKLSFNLRLFEGKFEDNAGRGIALTNRELELLAFLAVGNRPFTVDEIVDAIWGDNPETGARSLRVIIARVRQKAGDPTIIQSSRGGYLTTSVHTANLKELDELFKAVRRGSVAADWSERDLEGLVAWLRRLRVGFPANVGKWPWFAATDARYQRELYDVALLCARTALEARRFDVALRVAEELLDTDSGDDLAGELADRARRSLRSPATTS